jgi:hypothetical protein
MQNKEGGDNTLRDNGLKILQTLSKVGDFFCQKIKKKFCLFPKNK